MNNQYILSDRRGVSEIVGAFLIISIVLLVAISLVGFGYVLVGGSSDSAEDRTAEDSLEALGERLDEVTADSLDGNTGWEPPQGTANEFDAQPDEGMINITAETNETYWEATADSGNPGDLVDANDQVSYEEVTVGTLVYEGEDGATIGYQAGGLFHDEGGAVEVKRDPGIDVADDRLNLNLIDISSVENINEGQELVLEQDADQIGSSAVQEAVEDATVRDGEVTAPARINATITSEFAEGWETYGNTIEGVEEVIPGEDHPDLADDQVRIVFGEFAEGVEPINQEYDDDIIYTGLSEFAPDLYDDDEGEIEAENNGFSIADPDDEYLVSILYDDGDGYEWYVWDPDGPQGVDEEWVSAEEPDPDERVLDDAAAPDVVGDEFRIADDTWVAAINVEDEDRELNTFREEYLPAEYDGHGSDGILTNPIDIEDPADSEGNFGPFLEIESFDVTVVDDSGNPTGTDLEDDLTAGDENLDLRVEVENVGSGDADDDPVAFLQHADEDQSNRDDAWITDGEFTDVELGDTERFDTTVETVPGNYIITVGAGTADDALDDWKQTFVREQGDGDYQVDIREVDDDVTEGDEVEVRAKIENNDNDDGNQTVVLRGGPDNLVLDSKSDVEIDANTERNVEFSWTTRIDRESQWENIEVQTADDRDDYDELNVAPASLGSDFEVEVLEYEDTVDAGESAIVTAQVTNAGEGADQQLVTLTNDDDIVAGESAERTTELDGDESEIVTLSWDTFAGDVGEETLTVATEDDEEEISIEVEPSDQLTVEIEDVDHEVAVGSELEVEATVTNTFDEEVTEAVRLFDINGIEADTTELNLQAGESKSVDFTWEPGLASINEEGEITVATDDNEATAAVEVTEPQVSASEFEIDVTEFDDSIEEGGDINVDLTIENTGDEKDTQFVILEDFDESRVDIEEVELGPGEMEEDLELSWTNVANTQQYSDEEEITIRTADDETREEIDIEHRLLLNEVTVNPDEIDEDDRDETVEITAEIENTGESTITQDLIIEDLDGNEEPLIADADIEGGEHTVTAEYTVTDDWQRTGSATVKTDDDEMEQRIVIERDGPQCGTFDESDYDGSGDEDDPFQVTNIDELQCIGGSGLYDEGYHWEINEDIDAHGTEYWNDGDGFEPIGPRGNDYTTEASGDDSSNWETFTGEFDGNGHVIEGLHIERPDEQWVGLFGATNYPRSDGFAPGEGSVIENVRLADVYVHGERHVGGLVGQAGGTIEDSRSEGMVKAEYQLVGGLVGDGAHADLDNRLVAEGTVIGGDYRTPTGSDYWWNRGIGGLVGRSTWSTDVSTGYTIVDVEGPSMIGGITGSSSNVRSEFTQMYTASTVTIDGDSGEREQDEFQGGVAGTIENSDDVFSSSVYHDQTRADRTYGDEYETGSGWTDDAVGYDTDAMQGPSVLPDSEAENFPGVTTDDTEGTMSELDWDIWEPVYDINEDGEIVNKDYPVFSWELEAAGAVQPTIEDEELIVEAGETLEVNVMVENTNTEQVTQTVILNDPDGNAADSQEVSLAESVDPDSSEEITMTWTPDSDDVNEDTNEAEDIIVETDDGTDLEEVTVEEAPGAEFSVSITDDTPISGEEGDSIDVNATIENTGSETETQAVELRATGGVPVDNQTVQLDSDTSTDLTFTWNTSLGDADVETVSVTSDEDSDQAAVDIDERDAAFELEISDSPDQVTVSDTVEVDVEVEHVGDVEYTQLVLLGIDGVGTTDVETVTLDPDDGSETITLAWPTGVADVGPQSITAETGDGTASDSANVVVESLATSGEFQITELETNADEDEGESIDENENLDITATITNEDGDTSEQFVELVVADTTVAAEELTLEEGGSEEVEFTIDPVTVNPSIDEVTVRTVDDEQRQSVDIQSIDLDTDIDLEITEIDPDATEQGEVAAGDEITATIEVTDDGDGTVEVVSLYARSGITDQLVDTDPGVSLTEGDTVELTWQTIPGQGDDENDWEVVATAQGAESEPEAVWVDELVDPVFDDPFDDNNTGIDIDIDDIQIG